MSPRELILLFSLVLFTFFSIIQCCHCYCHYINFHTPVPWADPLVSKPSLLAYKSQVSQHNHTVDYCPFDNVSQSLFDAKTTFQKNQNPNQNESVRLMSFAVGSHPKMSPGSKFLRLSHYQEYFKDEYFYFFQNN